MVESVIPVGKDLGPHIEFGTVMSWSLDLGPRSQELEILQIGVWNHSHADLAAQRECRFDRRKLLDVLENANDPRPEDEKHRDIDNLIEWRALVEIDLKHDSLEPFLSEHILIPTGRAFGNIGDDEDLFAIGDDKPRLWLPQWTYRIWSNSHRDGPIWNTCARIAADAGVEPETVARGFVESLPSVVAEYCGYLEIS